MSAEYTRETWLKPIPLDFDAHSLLHRIASARLAGHELDRRRPPTKLHLVADRERFNIEIRPILHSSPTGWTIYNIEAKLVTSVNAKTEIKVRILPDCALHLMRWQRDDARTGAAVDLVTETLRRFVDDPKRAIAFGALNCGFCGRALTDPRSIEWGIGPECRAQFEQAIRLDELMMDTDRAAANGSIGEGDEQGMFAKNDSTEAPHA
ncbi:DUF6011 domain-containing protein [Thiocapsa bogorovii]|uniref:DUF6011 domain-containing protein n=1 Tax=Thiocapsa bogorovii TaxID=521689 RepID=UPI001E540A03|nr:DUF6011 domain-containing protein [Thiocapsa bogorovii]UHD15728.1 DUF6011 domain-containing protein [Thiocapsa bogorovii]